MLNTVCLYVHMYVLYVHMYISEGDVPSNDDALSLTPPGEDGGG